MAAPTFGGTESSSRGSAFDRRIASTASFIIFSGSNLMGLGMSGKRDDRARAYQRLKQEEERKTIRYQSEPQLSRAAFEHAAQFGFLRASAPADDPKDGRA